MNLTPCGSSVIGTGFQDEFGNVQRNGMFDGWPGESPQEKDAERILASQDCAYYVSGRLCIELKAIIISWLKNIVYFPSNF